MAAFEASQAGMWLTNNQSQVLYTNTVIQSLVQEVKRDADASTL